MQTAVVSIQKDIFDVFTENTVRVTDKKDIIKLEQWLSQRIDTMKESINGKSDTETIKNISVKEAKEHIGKLSEQKEALNKIERWIEQINSPRTISPAEITPTQLTANLFTQDVITDQTEAKINLEQKGRSIKMDWDSHALKIVDTGSGWQIEHENIIIGKIEDVAKLSRKINFFPEKIKELGIKEIQIPLTASKIIDLPNAIWSAWTSNIKKTKTWKINTEKLQTNTNPKSLPPHTLENPINTIDQKMDQLLKLVNLADMRMQYNNLKGRWDTLKLHMQNFNKNQDINADTPLFRSIFPALEHEINEFKKQLTNAIIDAQDKLESIKNSGIADLEKVKQLQQEIEDIKAKYKTIQDEFDLVHKDLFARIYKETPKQLPPHEETTTIVPPTWWDEEIPTSEPTSSETIDISAHLMDKESLVKKSIEQDVLEEYQHKYEKRRWPKRLAMYTFARWRQDNRINNRLGLSKKYNDAIETDITRQQRVASSIGNFASEYDMGVDAGKVKKTALASNDQVNTIANSYIKWVDKGWISRQDAIVQFNEFFKNNKDYQTGMTGSDIMEQLDDVAFMVAVSQHVKKNGQRTPDDYRKIQETISDFFGNHPTAQLHWVHFSNPNVASKTEMDTLCDHILAYKTKTAVKQLNNITANVKLYKVEKDTVDLTQSKLREHNRTRVDKMFTVANVATFGMAGSTVGNMLLKTGAGVWLAATWVGALWVVWWVAWLAAVLQWMKTYRDYLTEAQKTHEDAMTMGTTELDRRIKEVEWQIKKHTTMQKTLAFWGFGKHAIRTKQLNILKAVNDQMHKTGAMKPAIQLITEMQHVSRDKQALAIAETLARLKAGRELNTNFISGSTRALTEQERKSLLIQLRDSAAQRATKVWYGHLVPPRNANEEKWRMFWDRLIAVPQNNIGSIYQRKYAELKKNFQWMKDDINKGRKKMARRDARTNLTTSVTVAWVAAWVSAGVHALNGWTSWVDGTTIQWPHNEYALGKYETPITDKASWWENALNNGDKVSFQWEAAVDAVNASRWTFGDLGKEAAEVTKLAWSFDSATQDAVKEALTTELAKVKAEAIKAGADAGNVALTQQRWVDGVEEMLTKLQAAGKTGVTIENIKFDPSTFNPIDIQASAAAWSGVGMQDVIDRSVAFEATVNGVPWSWGWIEPLWAVWPGFSNTYAKPGDESKHDDSWSKRTKDLAKKDIEEKKKDEEKKDYNKDFEDKHGLPWENPTYNPTPPITDKDENRKKKWEDNKDKPFDPNDAGEQPQNHPYGDTDSKRSKSPRWREWSRTATDVPRFFDEDYPSAPEILSAQEAAERIIAAKYYNRPLSDMPLINDPKYMMGEYTVKIEEALHNKDYQKAVQLLAENITQEQEYVDNESQSLWFNNAIQKSLTAVDEVFDELAISVDDRSEIPSKNNIHIIPSYLFYAQNGRYEKNTLWFMQFMNGHIFVNYEALRHWPNGDRSPEEQRQVLTHAMTHEIIHGASTSNYHKTWKEKDGKIQNGSEDYVFLRRLGTQLVRRVDKVGNLKERWRALNEWLTESLNLYILEEKLGMPSVLNAYPGERKIVDMLSQKFGIKKTELYKFLISRKFGGDVIRKVYGQKKSNDEVSYERPGYITLLMELMDMEHLKHKNGSLPLAQWFIQEEKIVIKKADSKNFHPSLINKDGSLKEEILQAYPFITQA